MNSGKTFGFLLVAWWFAGSAEATEPRPGPGSVRVPAMERFDATVDPVDDPGLIGPVEEPEEGAERPGYVRVWNFAGTMENRLAVFLSADGFGETGEDAVDEGSAVWLGRGLLPGRTSDYQSVPSGRYELIVQPEPRSNFADLESEGFLQLTPDNLLTAERTGLAVRPGAYQTVAVTTADEGKVEVRIIDDGGGSREGTVLRVFNTLGETRPRLSLPNSDTSLAESIEEGLHEFHPRVAPRPVTYEVAFPINEYQAIRRFVEVNHGLGQSCTILVFRDRYGRPTVRAVVDAPRASP